jgi:2-polyprenyl-3-methyl-5-hydroxy-6-metoxy-1,4-benzoquinol methylase
MADLSKEAAEQRYAREALQGEAVAAGLENVWGWTGPAGRIRAARRAEFLVKAARIGPGVRCLELGAGTGEFTTRLAETGCELTALELSEATAAVCRERTNGRAEVVVGNAETGEGLEGREFDAIVGVSVLHHLNMELTLRNSFPLLRPGGRFAFSEPNMANPQVWAERHLSWVARRRHVTEHETAFRADQLARLLEAAGLVVELAEPFEFLHPALPARLIRPVLTVERWLERTPVRAIAGSIRVAGRRPQHQSR